MCVSLSSTKLNPKLLAWCMDYGRCSVTLVSTERMATSIPFRGTELSITPVEKPLTAQVGSYESEKVYHLVKKDPHSLWQLEFTTTQNLLLGRTKLVESGLEEIDFARSRKPVSTTLLRFLYILHCPQISFQFPGDHK